MLTQIDTRPLNNSLVGNGPASSLPEHLQSITLSLRFLQAYARLRSSHWRNTHIYIGIMYCMHFLCSEAAKLEYCGDILPS